MAETRLSVVELRKRLKLAGFDGSIRSVDALGPMVQAGKLCAYRRCSQRKPDEVFINTNAICDHQHLTGDIMDLVRAYGNGKLDRGWNRESNGDASTGILTREAALHAGIPQSQWATDPYRVS